MTMLRGGYTTGTCSAAAAKAATMVLCGQDCGTSVAITLPAGDTVYLDIRERYIADGTATAVVIKDAGDDPDVTDGAHVTVTAAWSDDDEFALLAGDGVGTVTLPGLQVPPGGPAINPVPRAMVRSAVREVTERGVRITISVPGGKELARRTFNRKLGIEGGVSILGTTGRVKPYSCEAIKQSLKCSLAVAAALGIRRPVLVPGNIGAAAAAQHLVVVAKQVVPVSNEWGFMLDALHDHDFEDLLVLGHPGKLAKLATGHWDTHSSRSPSASPFAADLAAKVFKRPVEEPNTVDGLFTALEEEERTLLARTLAHHIRLAVAARLEWGLSRVTVAITDMQSCMLGHEGNLNRWKEAGA